MIKWLISVVVFLGIVYFLGRSVNFSQLSIEIRHFNAVWLLLLLPLSLLISALKGWRFSILLHNSGVKVGLIETIKIYLAGYATASLPGGEATRIILIKKETRNGTTSKTSSAVVAQAYFELLSGAFLAVIGGLLFHIGLQASLVSLAILIGVAGLFISDRAVDLIYQLLSKVKKWQAWSRKILVIQNYLKQHLIDEKTHLPDKTAVRSVGISFLTNILGGIIVFIICLAYGNQIGIFEAIFIYSATMLIQGLAITPAGIGFTEGGMSSLLILFRVGINQAFSIVLIYRLVTLIFTTAIGAILMGILYWPKKR